MTMRSVRSAARRVPLVLGAAAFVSLSHALDVRQPAAPVTPQSALAQLAVTNEKETAELIPGKKWDRTAIAETAARIASLPDQAAAELLWRLASAPPGVDAEPVFARAVEAISPRVRGVAVAALIGQNTQAARRLLGRALSRERDPEILRMAVEGFSSLPRSRALAGLMAVVDVPDVSREFMAGAADALRRLSGAWLSDSPEAWREWWRANDPSEQ